MHRKSSTTKTRRLLRRAGLKRSRPSPPTTTWAALPRYCLGTSQTHMTALPLRPHSLHPVESEPIGQRLRIQEFHHAPLVRYRGQG